MTNIIQSSTLRNNLASVLVGLENEPQKFFLVTSKGSPKAAIVNLDFFEDLLALSSPKYLASIKKSREQAKKGELFTHEEAFGEL